VRRVIKEVFGESYILVPYGVCDCVYIYLRWMMAESVIKTLSMKDG